MKSLILAILLIPVRALDTLTEMCDGKRFDANLTEPLVNATQIPLHNPFPAPKVIAIFNVPGVLSTGWIRPTSVEANIDERNGVPVVPITAIPIHNVPGVPSTGWKG